MNRASPVDIRKAMDAANTYKQAGILFVPMPVFSEEEMLAKTREGAERLAQALSDMESES